MDELMLVIYTLSSAKECKLISMRAREALSALKAHGKVLDNVEKLAEVRARGSATVKEPGWASYGDILPTIEHIRSRVIQRSPPSQPS
jgi:hypothetical protein